MCDTDDTRHTSDAEAYRTLYASCSGEKWTNFEVIYGAGKREGQLVRYVYDPARPKTEYVSGK